MRGHRAKHEDRSPETGFLEIDCISPDCGRWTSALRQFRHAPGMLFIVSLALVILSGCAGVERRPSERRELPKVRVGLQVDAKAITVTATGMFEIGIKDSNRKPRLCSPGERWTFVPGALPLGDVLTGRGEDSPSMPGGPGSEVSPNRPGALASEGRTSPEKEAIPERRPGKGVEVIDPDGLSRGTLDVTLTIYPVESQSFLVLGGRRYRGSLEIFQNAKGSLTAVNVVDVESYLRGVVPNEIGGLSPQILEAVKAQAVAARTYTYYFAGRYANQGFDVLPTVQDQVYTGVDGEKPVSDMAIAETYGTILTFAGKPIRANYFSTCGGFTAGIDEVWPEAPVPYLRSVSDKEGFGRKAFCSESSSFRWKETWTGEQFEAIFKKYFRIHYPKAKQPSSDDRVVDVRIAKRSKSGRVRVLEIITSDDAYRITGDAIRLVIRRPDVKESILRSTLFDADVQREGGYVSTIVFSGGGNGHGVGMCQMGAIGMAKTGKKFKQILTHYYRGAKLYKVY